MDYDNKVRTLAGWIEGWEPLKEIEAEISAIRKTLREAQDRAVVERGKLAAACPQKLSDLEYRFWSKVAVVDDDDSCWEFMGGRRPVQGEEYGLFRLDSNGRDGGGTIGAHRMAFVLANGGEIPDHTRHTCDNPPCCRPSHLLNGTHVDNMRDKAERGRAKGKTNQRGEANDSAVLTDVIVIDARRRARAGETQQAIADVHGVSRFVLSYAIGGKTWAHLDEVEPPVEARPGGTRLVEDDIRAIRSSQESARVIAQTYGITAANVYAIKARRSWKHVE